MAIFTALLSDLCSAIYALARPSSVTVAIKESADLVVTSILSAPALLTTTKESHAAAQQWALKPYSILMGNDNHDVLFSEDITLNLDIIPSITEHLSITWAELYTILGDALLVAPQIVI